MLHISAQALREGCERAHDLFSLNRLRPHHEASTRLGAVYQALGMDSDMQDRLQEALLELVPVKGLPMLEEATASAMAEGVLVGLLIADSVFPAEELDLPVLPAS